MKELSARRKTKTQEEKERRQNRHINHRNATKKHQGANLKTGSLKMAAQEKGRKLEARMRRGGKEGVES